MDLSGKEYNIPLNIILFVSGIFCQKMIAYKLVSISEKSHLKLHCGNIVINPYDRSTKYGFAIALLTSKARCKNKLRFVVTILALILN